MVNGNSNGRFRFTPQIIVLGLLTALVVTACVFAAKQAYNVVHASNQPASSFLKNRDEYLGIAMRINSDLRTMNAALPGFLIGNDTRAARRYTQTSAGFRQWIDSQKSTTSHSKLILITPVDLTINVNSLVNDMDTAFTRYHEEVLRTQTAKTTLASNELAIAFTRINDRSLALFQLAGEARTQATYIQLFNDLSQQWIPGYLRLSLATLGLLVVVACWLGLLLYRLAYLPLRMKLVQSSAIIEKQQKLAHFGELAAGLAHEIRNPLMAINTRVFTLQKSVPPSTPEYEDTAVIRGEINRLERIVSDFLKLARPADPEFTNVPVEPLLREVRLLLLPQLIGQSITLDIESVVPATVRADPQQLKQVLINLIRNAAESIGHDGHISLRVRPGHQELHGQSQDVIIIEVTDTGPGIPPEIEKRLFDPFFSTKEGGSGLGLSICAHIVERHGGAIELLTKLDKGTTFGIVLPISKDAP